MTAQTKGCKKCRIVKPLDDFHRQANAPDGRRYACKACVKLYYQSTQYQTPSRIRRYNLRKKYGISVEEYDAMFAAQEGKCAVCGTPDVGPTAWSMCVDHDHRTGAIRGLTCNACNAVMGFFDDDPARLRLAADYLERTKRKALK